MPWFRFGAKRMAGADMQGAERLGKVIDEQFSWTNQFVMRHQLPQSRESLLSRLAYIQQRRADKQFYLAVIGEFNSGKSTLINALIGDVLLRVGGVPVTANPTHLVYGKRINVEATFPGVGRLSLRSDRKRMLGALGALRPQITPTGNETSDVIGALTADPTVARAISGCVIQHPAAFLRDGVVIIDTPGLNDNAQLEQSTVNVIKDEADLCLIAIPATFQSAMTLITFLREQLNPMLHRCVFVVTKMDMDHDDAQERMREQERVLAHVTRALEGLGLSQPVVYPVAAQASVLQMRRATLSADQRYWAEQFDELRQELAQRLQQDRQLAVLERLIGLLAGILADLDGAMASQQQAIAQQAETLRQAAIADLDAFVMQEREQAFAQVDAAWNGAQQSLRSQTPTIRQQAEAAVKAEIDGAGSADALKAVLESKVSPLLNSYGASFKQALDTCAGHIDTASTQTGTQFTVRFNAAFARLKAVSGGPPTQSMALMGASTSLNAASASVSALQAFNEATGAGALAVGGGAVVGGAIGTFLIPIPGLGTFIGALFGGWLGSLFGPSLDSLKASAWEHIQPQVEPQFAEALRQGLAQLDARRQQRRAELVRLIDQFATQYRSAYNQALDYQRQERQRLESTMATIAAERAEVSQRRAILEARLAEAKSLHVASRAAAG